MANPSLTAQYGYDLGLYLTNDSSGSTAWISRVQRVEPTATYRTNPHYEIGSKDKVGSTQEPVSYRLVIEQNLYGSPLDFLLAGKNPTPVGAQQFNLGDMLGKTNSGILVSRDTAGNVDKNWTYTLLRVAQIQYAFTVRDAIKETVTLEGTQGNMYTSAFPQGSWGSLDTTSAGAIIGKDSRVWLSSGSVATSRGYRLQSFNINIAFPVTPVMELGNRNLVGQMTDSPDVSMDFDVLTADYQPTEKLFAAAAGGYDMNIPSALFTTLLRVYDPDQTEAASLLRMFKIENSRFVSGTPTRAQVRALATERYSLVSYKTTTAGSGGFISSNANDLS